MGEGQERRHLRPGRPLAGDAGRSARPAGSPPLARGERPPLPGWQHPHHGVRHGAPAHLRHPLHQPADRPHPPPPPPPRPLPLPASPSPLLFFFCFFFFFPFFLFFF